MEAIKYYKSEGFSGDDSLESKYECSVYGLHFRISKWRKGWCRGIWIVEQIDWEDKCIVCPDLVFSDFSFGMIKHRMEKEVEKFIIDLEEGRKG